MLRIHKEGFTILLVSIVLLGGCFALVNYFLPIAAIPMGILCSVLFLLILQFFRNPIREISHISDNILYAPADGKIVTIEETEESEYFQDKRIQVSIFMSPLNVHVNRNPISGTINYFKYHPGKYLVAWHPKSSTENERTTVVIGNGSQEILLRQIAGAVAKRIVNYTNEGDQVTQGADMGFIKFGSRVDLFLPIGTEIQVKVGDKVKGNKTIIAKI